MKNCLFLSIVFLSQFVAANSPCPVWYVREVPAHSLYFEMGGGSVYSSLGYSGALNCADDHSYLSANIGFVACPKIFDRDQPIGVTSGLEFHQCLSRGSIFYLSVGMAYTRVFNSAGFESGTLKSLEKQNYLCPMIGIELLFDNHFAIDLKYQPFTTWTTELNCKDIQPFAGIKFKYMIGQHGYQRYGGGF